MRCLATRHGHPCPHEAEIRGLCEADYQHARANGYLETVALPRQPVLVAARRALGLPDLPPAEPPKRVRKRAYAPAEPLPDPVPTTADEVRRLADKVWEMRTEKERRRAAAP